MSRTTHAVGLVARTPISHDSSLYTYIELRVGVPKSFTEGDRMQIGIKFCNASAHRRRWMHENWILVGSALFHNKERGTLTLFALGYVNVKSNDKTYLLLSLPIDKPSSYFIFHNFLLGFQHAFQSPHPANFSSVFFSIWRIYSKVVRRLWFCFFDN